MDQSERITRESALRKAVIAGDPYAFEALCRPLMTSVYNFALARTGRDRSLAEEVVQEAWLIAVRKIRGFDPLRGSFESWVKGIAVRVAQNAWRSSQRRPPIAMREPDQLPESSSSEGNQASQTARDLGERMSFALTELPESYQRILRARYHQGKSVREIADRWGKSQKAIESLLARARGALRQSWNRAETESES